MGRLIDCPYCRAHPGKMQHRSRVSCRHCRGKLTIYEDAPAPQPDTPRLLQAALGIAAPWLVQQAQEQRQHEQDILATQAMTEASPERILQVLATKPYDLSMLRLRVARGDPDLLAELRAE